MLAFSALLDLLGWDHAKEGDKVLNFAADFDLLGVTFNLGDMRLGILTKDSQGRHVVAPGLSAKGRNAETTCFRLLPS